jgi:DTW domain-containing protein
MFESSKQGEHASLGLSMPVAPQKNSIQVVILQHPQEPDKVLGTAALCVRSLQNAKLRIGLSWSSLAKAVGEPEAKPSEWAVIYLGGSGEKKLTEEVTVLNRKKEVVEHIPPLRGIIVLDGTWSQAKTLWWRNAWFLKLHRIILQPKNPSLYGRLRKEPRKECVSTIEAVALTLRGLGESEKVSDALLGNFAKMLELYREAGASAKASAASMTASKIPGSQTE